MRVRGPGRLLLAATLLLALIVLDLPPGGGSAGAAPPTAATGVLTGRVTRGPVTPAEKAGGPPSSEPAAGVRIIISRPSGGEVATALTGKKGEYRLSLPPGHYQVDLAPLGHRGFARELPAPVSISRDRETRLDIRIDTGMR